jgi:folate-binding protein YgfZ
MRARRRDDLAVLSVRGEDARSWLNGQVTNDVRSTKPGDAVHALVLNAKGRILADVIVIDRGDRSLAMVIPKSEHEVLRMHLEKYVIMEDVELVLEALDVVEVDGTCEGERYPAPWLGEGAGVWIGDAASMRDASVIDPSEAELSRLRAGRPAFGVDFGATTYPQEAGLDSAVSFQKGCYLGQEVVCMLENRGQLSRALVRLSTDALVAPGAKVLDADGAEVGAVTSAIDAPDGALALAYVKRVALGEGKALRIGGGAARVIGPAKG